MINVIFIKDKNKYKYSIVFGEKLENIVVIPVFELRTHKLYIYIYITYIVVSGVH